MPFRVFALMLAAVIAAAGITVAAMSLLPGFGAAIALPLTLAIALAVRHAARR